MTIKLHISKLVGKVVLRGKSIAIKSYISKMGGLKIHKPFLKQLANNFKKCFNNLEISMCPPRETLQVRKKETEIRILTAVFCICRGERTYLYKKMDKTVVYTVYVFSH